MARYSVKTLNKTNYFVWSSYMGNMPIHCVEFYRNVKQAIRAKRRLIQMDKERKNNG